MNFQGQGGKKLRRLPHFFFFFVFKQIYELTPEAHFTNEIGIADDVIKSS
jgi:hypothetical protein